MHLPPATSSSLDCIDSHRLDSHRFDLCHLDLRCAAPTTLPGVQRLALVFLVTSVLSACGPAQVAPPPEVHIVPQQDSSEVDAAYVEGPADVRCEDFTPTLSGQLSVDAPNHVAAAPLAAHRTNSGLATCVIAAGDSVERPASPQAEVTVHYSGWTTDGELFDSSVTRGRPASFRLDRVIAGWTEGLQLMRVGERRRFWIPEELAYQGRARRPAGVLVFDVELLEVSNPAPAPDAPPDVAGPPPSATLTSSGLHTRVLRPGTGQSTPSASSRVTVHFTIWTPDGALVQSSATEGAPSTFDLSRVVPGFAEGVQLMVVGERRRLWIPASLGYPATSSGPQGRLVADVELVSIL